MPVTPAADRPQPASVPVLPAVGPRAEVATPAAPVVGPQPVRVGPAVPVAAPAVQVPMGPATRPQAAPVAAPAPASAAPAAFVASPAALLAAADAMPLRPLGASPVSGSRGTYRDPEALPAGLTSALPGVAAGTAEAVAKTPELPLGIAAVVVLFLLVQNRIDRRDPKLALARIEDDRPLEFAAREPVVHLRLVQAA